MPLEVPNRDEWFPPLDGLPQPDWLAIHEWIQNVVSAGDRRGAAEEITRHWLARLATALGDSYSVAASEHSRVLSTLNEKGRERIFDFLEKAHARVFRAMGEPANLRQPRSLVVLRLADFDTTLAVIASIDPEGKTAWPANDFFHPNSGPMTYCEEKNLAREYNRLARAVAHHLLCHLPLPTWLHVAQTEALTVDLAGGRFAVLDEDLLALHQSSWTAKSIQNFWSGRFFWDQEWQPLANSLAEVLLDIIRRELRPDPCKLQRFVQQAARNDSGEAAARRYWGVGLGEIAAVFLGDGDWSPKPQSWETESNHPSA